MKTCIPIITLRDINKANKTKADFLELRLDLYKNYNLENLVQKCKKPVIVTIKNQNIKLLQQAINLKVKYIDLDYKNIKLINYFKNNNLNSKLIISYHNFKKTPDFKVLDNLIKRGVNKIAVKINNVEDNIIIAKFLEKYPNKIIAIGMGELGMMTRLHSNNLVSYFSLDENNKSAEGQIEFNKKDLKLYGIIGKNIGYTKSPEFHNNNFSKKKINALYQVWDCDDLKKMMEIFRFFNLQGASVTIPYKQDIKKYLDKIDNGAKKIGAVNTLVNKNGKIIGYNTDWYGVNQAIINNFSSSTLKDKRIIILGNGGAAKAAKYGLEKYSNNVRCLNRKQIRKYKEKFDVLINATPVYNKLLINKDLIEKHNIIMDMIYYKNTELLKIAKKKGCIAINGMPMLEYQGKLAFKLWNNKLL